MTAIPRVAHQLPSFSDLKLRHVVVYAGYSLIAYGAVKLTILPVVRSLKLWVYRKGKKLPHPPTHGLLGNIPTLASKLDQPHKHIDSAILALTKEFPKLGKLWMLRLVAVDFVIVSDPEAIKEVLVTKNYDKSPTYDALVPFIGSKSLLISSPAVWAKQRKAFNPGFTYQHLKGAVPIFAEKTRLLIERLKGAADTGKVVQLHKEATLLTLDVICQVALSMDLGLLSAKEGAPVPIYTHFMELLQATAEYARRPDQAIAKWLPWAWWKWWKAQVQLDRALISVIKSRLVASADKTPDKPLPQKEPNAAAPGLEAESAKGIAAEDSVPGSVKSKLEKAGKSDDILGLAIKTTKEGGGKGLDLLDVLSQIKTFLFAGHDTTATTVGFAVYELSQHPEMEAKVLEEVDRVCPGGKAPEAEDLSQLKYLTCVIKETLRMWPPGGTARMAPAGTTLMGYDIGGKVLYLPHLPVHRDPDLWGPDAEVFRPERWQDEAYVAALHPMAYMPFSKGPRDCIGQTFALMEAKSLLASLYQAFTFKYALKEPEEQAYQITSYPRFRVPVTVHYRERAVQ